VVGPIEILPPLSPVHAAAAARAVPPDPVDGATGRPGGAGPRPADVVIDVDAAGDPRPPTTRKVDSRGTAEPGSEQRGRRRTPPHRPAPESRRSPYATAIAGAAHKPALRDAGNLAYRSAEGLGADYAPRGTFYDLTF